MHSDWYPDTYFAYIRSPEWCRVVARYFENNSVRHYLADEGFSIAGVQTKTEVLRILGLRTDENMKLFIAH